MCGIFDPCCGNANKAFHCLSLRAFAFIWLAISIFIAILQFVAGAYLATYLTPVDTMLGRIKDKIMGLDDPTLALKYYDIVAGSLGALWRGLSLLTTFRGIFDMIAIICWIVGWYRQKMALVYIFIVMMAVDFFFDFCLFIIFMIVLNSLYVTFFYPGAIALPFVFYGWQAFIGPYFLHLLLSHAYGKAFHMEPCDGIQISDWVRDVWAYAVMSVGGNGTEMKTWQEVKELKAKAASKDKEDDKDEKAALLDDELKKRDDDERTEEAVVEIREDDEV